MKINWKRGLFRLWLVGSILWTLGALVFMLIEANRQAEFLVMLRCDTTTMTIDEWGACYQASQGPSEGGTWFFASLREYWFILPGGSILIIMMIGVGAGIAKIIGWVARGFGKNSN